MLARSSRFIVRQNLNRSFFTSIRASQQVFSDKDMPFQQNAPKTQDQKKAEHLYEETATGEKSRYGNTSSYEPMNKSETSKFAHDSTDTRQSSKSVPHKKEAVSEDHEYFDKKMEKDRETAQQYKNKANK
jgi:hypothetical protein